MVELHYMLIAHGVHVGMKGGTGGKVFDDVGRSESVETEHAHTTMFSIASKSVDSEWWKRVRQK